MYRLLKDKNLKLALGTIGALAAMTMSSNSNAAIGIGLAATGNSNLGVAGILAGLGTNFGGKMLTYSSLGNGGYGIGKFILFFAELVPGLGEYVNTNYVIREPEAGPKAIAGVGIMWAGVVILDQQPTLIPQLGKIQFEVSLNEQATVDSFNELVDQVNPRFQSLFAEGDQAQFTMSEILAEDEQAILKDGLNLVMKYAK